MSGKAQLNQRSDGVVIIDSACHTQCGVWKLYLHAGQQRFVGKTKRLEKMDFCRGLLQRSQYQPSWLLYDALVSLGKKRKEQKNYVGRGSSPYIN
eukprot:1161242-Pelagomonas_calceolata.AAC.1